MEEKQVWQKEIWFSCEHIKSVMSLRNQSGYMSEATEQVSLKLKGYTGICDIKLQNIKIEIKLKALELGKIIFS